MEATNNKSNDDDDDDVAKCLVSLSLSVVMKSKQKMYGKSKGCPFPSLPHHSYQASHRYGLASAYPVLWLQMCQALLERKGLRMAALELLQHRTE